MLKISLDRKLTSFKKSVVLNSDFKLDLVSQANEKEIET